MSTLVTNNLVTNPRAANNLTGWAGTLATTRSASGGPSSDAPSYASMVIANSGSATVWDRSITTFNSGIVTDPSGNIYVGSTGSTLRKYDSTGVTYTTVTLHSPVASYRMKRDSLGNFYVLGGTTSYNGQKIQKYNSSWVYQNEWVVVPSSPSDPYRNTAIAVDGSNNVLFYDGLSNTVTKFSSTGTVLASWAAAPNKTAIAVDGSGNIYLVGASNVHVYTSSGTFVTQWADPSHGLDIIYSGGSLYTATRLLLTRFDFSGNQLSSWPLAPSASFVSISADPSGSIVAFVPPDSGSSISHLTKVDITQVSSLSASMTVGPLQVSDVEAAYTALSSVAFNADADVQLQIGWILNGASTPLFNPGNSNGIVRTISAADGWVNLDPVTFTPPASNFGRASIRVTLTPTGGATYLPAGTAKFSAFAFVQNPINVTYSGGYFDGDMADSADVVYDWLGTSQDSISTVTQTFPDTFSVAAVATPVPVPVPTPGVTPRSFKQLQLIDYTVNGESTPVDPSDTTGAVGQFNLIVDENDQTPYLSNIPVDLIDPTQGTTRGTMRGVSADNGVATITADSRMALLTVTRQAQPFDGTLEDAFRYYLGLCGITEGIVVDSTIASNPVTLLGWNDLVWDRIKQLCTAQRIETSLVSNNIVLRPLRTRNAENYRDSSRSWGLDSSQLAQSIQVNYYNKATISNGLVYPIGGWNTDVAILSVPAGETVVETLDVDASLSAIQQPVAQTFVAPDYTASSVYTVIGSDGLPIPPAQWADGGGSVTVEIGEDTRTVVVTMKGMAETQYSPYRLALSSDDSTYYSTLRLVGTGVSFNKQTLTMETSVTPDRVSQTSAPVVDNENINTEDEARHLGLWALKSWGSAKHTINVQTTGINRLGDTGSYAYPTIAEFNVTWAPGDDIADFNTLWAGKTIADFNKFWYDTVANDFANQAFGNIEGAIVSDRDAKFRIRSNTVTPFGVSYNAQDDTTIADFNEVWAGLLISDYNAQWIGQRGQDFSTTPLRKN